MTLTTLCYIEKDGAYLMLHRVKKEKDINKDKWIGIGGHFETGESPDDCLLREVYEETGLTLTSFQLRGIVTLPITICVCTLLTVSPELSRIAAKGLWNGWQKTELLI